MLNGFSDSSHEGKAWLPYGITANRNRIIRCLGYEIQPTGPLTISSIDRAALVGRLAILIATWALDGGDRSLTWVKTEGGNPWHIATK